MILALVSSAAKALADNTTVLPRTPIDLRMASWAVLISVLGSLAEPVHLAVPMSATLWPAS